MSYLGSNKMGKVYLGGTAIGKAYLGSDLVFSAETGQKYDAQVEYLECSGGQYVVLPIYFDDATDAVEIDFRRSEETAQQRFCCPLGGNKCGGTLYINKSNYCSYYNNDWVGFSTPGRPGLGRHIYKVDYYNQTLSFDLVSSAFTRSASGPATAEYGVLFSQGVFFKGRIYSFKYWRSGVLVYDLIPVKKNGVGYLYDKVTDTLFANQGTGNFSLGGDIAVGDDDVTLLDSLDSNEQIEFVTGVPITTTHTWEIDSVSNKSRGWATWAMCWDTQTAWRTCDCLLVQRNSSGDDYYLYIGNLNGGYSEQFTPRTARCTQGYDGTKYFCDNYSYSFSPRTYGQNWPLTVRSQHIYGVKIWNNGVLSHHFLPASKNGATGMYDIVTDNFITI